jgi:hypothetical protein
MTSGGKRDAVLSADGAKKNENSADAPYGAHYERFIGRLLCRS